MPSVLHVSAHMGGGIGSVLSSVAVNAKNSSLFTHEFMLLEPTKSEHYIDICSKNDISICLADDVNIVEKINTSDIVQIEWWHHPLTMKFMYDYLTMTPCRLIIWSHISGCTYPYIPANFVRLPEKFVFASPYSYENPLWNEDEKNHIRNISDVVVSSGGNFTNSTYKTKLNQLNFAVGYIGFLGYSKICPNFIEFCRVIDIPDVSFIIVGDLKYGEALVNDAKKSGIWDKFKFTGYSTNVGEKLNIFDVFGYLLNPEHTGASENSLLEAMAAGVPPVVLNQSVERYIVQDGHTGFVVNNSVEYGKIMRYLYENPQERLYIGENAKRYVLNKFNIKNTVNGLENVYKSVLNFDKKTHNIDSVFGNSPYEWFKSCLANKHYKTLNLDLILSPSKGSIYQYMKYFPEEKNFMEYLSELISRGER